MKIVILLTNAEWVNEKHEAEVISGIAFSNSLKSHLENGWNNVLFAVQAISMHCRHGINCLATSVGARSHLVT